jgi:methylmalonyl-CoA mutase C-terminal domain/subunit
LKEQQSGDILVFGGGIIPQDDIGWLKERGIREVFTPGASTEDIIEWVKRNIHPEG